VNISIFPPLKKLPKLHILGLRFSYKDSILNNDIAYICLMKTASHECTSPSTNSKAAQPCVNTSFTFTSEVTHDIQCSAINSETLNYLLLHSGSKREETHQTDVILYSAMALRGYSR
jgi:hypothetical protein